MANFTNEETLEITYIKEMLKSKHKQVLEDKHIYLKK